MSDSRFHLKVTFEVYGKEFKWEPSLNWCSEPGVCDERISQWFADRYEEAYRAFQESRDEAEEEAMSKAEEAKERKELARLLAKYPDATPQQDNPR